MCMRVRARVRVCDTIEKDYYIHMYKLLHKIQIFWFAYKKITDFIDFNIKYFRICRLPRKSENDA